MATRAWAWRCVRNKKCTLRCLDQPVSRRCPCWHSATAYVTALAEPYIRSWNRQHTQTQAQAHTHTRARARAHTHTHAPTHAHTRTHARTHTHVHTHTRHDTTHTCTHTHTHTHTRARNTRTHAHTTCHNAHARAHTTQHTRARAHTHTHARTHARSTNDERAPFDRRELDPKRRYAGVPVDGAHVYCAPCPSGYRARLVGGRGGKIGCVADALRQEWPRGLEPTQTEYRRVHSAGISEGRRGRQLRS